jgi:hypothetical protein
VRKSEIREIKDKKTKEVIRTIKTQARRPTITQDVLLGLGKTKRMATKPQFIRGLAKMLCVHPRTIQEALKALVEIEVVAVKKKKTGGFVFATLGSEAWKKWQGEGVL